MRANSKERETWQAERRADEAAAIETWEHAAAMPPLDGSDKAIEWGRQVRYHLVAAAHDNAEASGQSDEDFNSDVETPAQMITSASWWIDQRDSAASDVAELVADVASDPSSDTGSENPF
jgi:hypothetical protein